MQDPDLDSSPQPTSDEPENVETTINRKALMVVFLVVFIDLLGFGIVLPLLPLFGRTFIAELVAQPKTNPLTGIILGLLMASFSAMQFVFAPMWGRISDRAGRRPILLIGLSGSVVFYALFGYASALPQEAAMLALTLLFVARLGAGIAGATIPTAQAAIADSTSPEKRKVGMAMIGAAFGIGFALGPLIGYLCLTITPDYLGSLGFAAAGLSLIALLLGLRLLPETRKFGKESPRRRWISWHQTREVLSMPTIGLLVLIFFLTTMGFGSFEPTLALLCRDVLRLQEDNQIFLVFAFVGFVLLFTQGFLYRRLAPRLSEHTFMTAGIILMGLGLGVLGAYVHVAQAYPAVRQLQEFNEGAENNAAQSSIETSTDTQEETAEESPAIEVDTSRWSVYLAWMLFSLTISVVGFAFLTPSVQSLISRRSDPERQGEVLGVNQSASALARILGPFLGVALYFAHPSHLLPYVFGAVILLAMLPVLPRIQKE